MCTLGVVMQHERSIKDNTVNVSTKVEKILDQGEKGPETVFTRTKRGRVRLLRRCTSQKHLLDENQKDGGEGRNRQDSIISSTSSGLLFVRPLSSSTKKQGAPALFPRPKSSLMEASGTSKTRKASDSNSDRLTRRRSSSSSSSKTSVPSVVRRSSYFSLQGLRRTIVTDQGEAKQMKKKGSREDFGRFFKGMVTVINEEEMEEKRQLLHFPLWARLICAKKPEHRSEAEMNKLVTLLRGMKSFGKFSRESQRNLCQTMTYACYDRRRLIVRQGHPGYCFYFIVSGSVSVTITRLDYKTGVYVTNTVDVLEKNEAFGEIALISEEARRTATIICRERVEVLVVNRETILEYCPDVFQREYEEKLQVMRSHSLFDGWGEDLLRSLSFRSHIREFSYGKLIDEDSTTSESIYFIIKGKIEMLRRVDLQAVLKSDVTIDLYKHRPLPRPIASLPRKKGSNTCYINVGSLQPGDSWDLTTMGTADQEAGPGNILVSAGVRVLKVPKRRVIELSPRGHMETFEENFNPKHRCLSDEELYRDYLAAEAWLDYRKKVVRNVMDSKAGRFIAHVSATEKGSSGWTTWPGSKPGT
ncbi:uncharacterized protein LOC113664796 isoform X2 [Pocillopora damicornis]|uniref:uncharacterized protein LOC113664796 isoform X2 n=1 Tax=Pocillopora damicornis TaxID=46731 RepID=UPI000F558163|nr:uncharacterized protein LOC113664796 isoform X2 [Pocillopora damicornis]